jgi:hypothetical protein
LRRPNAANRRSRPAIGSAYAIAISPERVRISSAVIAQSRPEHLDVDEMRRGLGTWIAAILRARCNPA